MAALMMSRGSLHFGSAADGHGSALLTARLFTGAMIQTDRYLFDANRRTGLLRITILGFWDLSDVEQFAQDHAREIVRVTSGGHRARTLIDYSSSAIQSQAVVAAFQYFALNVTVRSIGVALYTTGNFARLQARRIAAVRPDIRAFDSLDAAMQWLDGLIAADQGQAA